PECFAGLHVERAEGAVEIADEADAAVSRDHTREKRRPLLATPDLSHRLHVVGGEFADVAVGAGHLEETAVGAGAARSIRELELAAVHLHARLTERNDQGPGLRHVTHRLPVVSAFRARTRIHPLTRLLLEDVWAILRCPGLRVDRLEDVLEDGFLVAEKRAVA